MDSNKDWLHFETCVARYAYKKTPKGSGLGLTTVIYVALLVNDNHFVH